MKSINKIWGIGLLAMLLSLVVPGKSIAQGGYVSDQQFYDDLSPYGTWVSDSQYGNVWIPDADENFRPYATRGHWVVTDYGNTWVSDYEWGWAPFHYGRWRYDDYYGWEWIPGHEWAPAWVSWRHGGGYYGWAPLMPGISISLSFGSGYSVPDYYWTCAPQAYIASPRIYNYYVPHTRVVNIIHNTTIINNTYVKNNVTYVSGPRVQEIRQVTRNNNIRVYNINNASKPGASRVSRNALNIYRPAIQKTPGARPARVVDAVAYKNQRPNERIANKSAGAGFNHAAATRLATVARSNTPDAKLVRVNPVNNARPNPVQPGNRPANRPNQPNTPQQRQQQQAQQHQQQPAQQRQQQQAQQQQAQQRQQQQAQQAQQQQAQQAQQQQAQQRQQQQAQQRQQQQAQQRQQQQAQQRQQQQAQQRQAQQAQQRQQQQAQQRQQQQAQQRQQQQRAQRPPQQPRPQPQPKPEQRPDEERHR